MTAQPKPDRGVVKFFDPTRRFGFIISDFSGDDVYVPLIAVERAGLATLNKGDRFTFTTQTKRGDGKMEAFDLKPVEQKQ